MDIEDVTPLIQNILVIDSEGKRIAVKYYTDEWKLVSSQAAYEKDVFSKVNRAQQRNLDGDIILFNDVAVVFKRMGDIVVIVTGSQDENELILFNVLQAFSEALNVLLRGAVEKKSVLENLDLVLITLDETVDEGVILEVDANVIAQRVTMRTEGGHEMSYAEHTFSQTLANAKQQLARSLLS